MSPPRGGGSPDSSPAPPPLPLSGDEEAEEACAFFGFKIINVPSAVSAAYFP